MGMSTLYGKSHKVVDSICLGFDEELESFLNNGRVDMVRIENVKIFYRHIKAWHTCRDVKLFYVPTTPPM